MTSKELFNEIHDFCLQNKDEANIKKYSRYFKGEYDAYGVDSKIMLEKIKELKNNKEITLEVIIETAPPLIKSSKYEEPSFALLLINERKKTYTSGTFSQITKWYDYGIRNWAHADMLGMYILPEFILKDIIKIEDFSSWIKAANSYQRRSVPVTFIKFIKKREYNFSFLFDFIEPLMTDPMREVQQGTGWFLREAWKIKPQETETFLLKWKNTGARLIFQYACEKMTKEQKLKYRKEK